MIFSNVEFFVFFGIFFVLYYATLSRVKLQNTLIMGASYVFYGWWDPRFLSLIAVSTAVDFVIGLAVSERRLRFNDVVQSCALLVGLTVILFAMRVDNVGLIASLMALAVIFLNGLYFLAKVIEPGWHEKLYLSVSIGVNLGILGVFKYFNFFSESFMDMAKALGLQPGDLTVGLILPVGISFYTFQTMSYTIDVYRRHMLPTHDFIKFGAFVSFFPQLVAGPIERAVNLLPQFDTARRLTLEGLHEGALLFLWGYYKKVVIADNLAPISDQVFSNPGSADAGEIMVGVLAFTFQIYGDFSGYSDMARGVAKMLGFDLMLNFKMPYFSRTPSEFWRRWHISLSSWLRDYLYISLGGNRGGELFTYRNLMLTMLLGGLWHGAAWTFVFWGLYHGLILVIYRIFRIDDLLEKVTGATRLAMHGAAILIMFALAVISWVPFRAASFSDAFFILGQLSKFQFGPTGSELLFYIGPLLVMEAASRIMSRLNFWEHGPWLLKYNIALFVLWSAVFLGAEGGQAFIYFDF